MDAFSRHDRTVRQLEARLEALALASERRPAVERLLERQIIATVAATRHAVALELITSDEAGAIWAGVASRHPTANWCAAGPELAA
jgi:hypothetical protein